MRRRSAASGVHAQSVPASVRRLLVHVHMRPVVAPPKTLGAYLLLVVQRRARPACRTIDLLMLAQAYPHGVVQLLPHASGLTVTQPTPAKSMDGGKSSHGMPVWSTNSVKLRAASSLMARLVGPPLPACGKSGNQPLKLLPQFFAYGTSGRAWMRSKRPVRTAAPSARSSPRFRAHRVTRASGQPRPSLEAQAE